jgi:integrase
MPNYAREGKIETPITDEEFDAGMATGHFSNQKHKGFVALLFYTAVRKSEALRVTTDQFKLVDNKKTILFDVGPRMKKIKRKKICPQCKIGNRLSATECRLCRASLVNVEPINIGKPLRTQSLPIPLDAPYAIEIAKAIANSKPHQRVFTFSSRTAYNIVRRVFKYPHLFRLSRITWFFAHHWTIDQVISWTGLTLAALQPYIGQADITRMGKSMAKREKLEEEIAQ